jgi:pseudouridine kinase
MEKPVVCLGAALVDEIFTCLGKPIGGTSNPATLQISAGGVARNIAHHLGQLKIPVELISHFGTDAGGDFLVQICGKAGIGTNHSGFGSKPTGKFAGILSPEGDLFTAVAFSALESEITPAFLDGKKEVLSSASLLVADCNLSRESLDFLLNFSRESGIPLILEPVSVPKVQKLIGLDLSGLFLLTPNEAELKSLLGNESESIPEKNMEKLVSQKVKQVWCRMGAEGSVFRSEKTTVSFPAPEVLVTDSTGAGDAALAGWIYGWWHKKNPEDCLRFGHALAALVLSQKGSTLPDLTTNQLEEKALTLIKA